MTEPDLRTIELHALSQHGITQTEAMALVAEVRRLQQYETRIVVTGGRNFYDEDALLSALDALRPSRVAQGGCPTGADKIARDWCASNKVECVTYAADWEAHGAAAGPMRSREMIDKERPDFVLSTNGGNGTRAAVRYARKIGRVVLGVVT